MNKHEDDNKFQKSFRYYIDMGVSIDYYESPEDEIKKLKKKLKKAIKDEDYLKAARHRDTLIIKTVELWIS